MKTSHWIAAAALISLLTGCSAITRPMVYRSIKKEPVIDSFYLHPGAKKGDKARYASDHKSMTDTIQVARIADIRDGLFEVVLEPESKATLNFEKHLFVTPQGKVQRAYALIDGERFPLAVVAPSPTGYFRSKKLEKLAMPQDLTLAGRSYVIESVLTYEIFLDTTVMAGDNLKADITIVHLIDPRIPFGIVKTMMVMDTRYTPGAEKFLGVILKAANPDVFSSREVLSDLFTATRTEREQWRLVFTYLPPDTP